MYTFCLVSKKILMSYFTLEGYKKKGGVCILFVSEDTYVLFYLRRSISKFISTEKSIISKI